MFTHATHSHPYMLGIFPLSLYLPKEHCSYCSFLTEFVGSMFHSIFIKRQSQKHQVLNMFCRVFNTCRTQGIIMTFTGISVVAGNHFNIHLERWYSESDKGERVNDLALQVPKALTTKVQSKERVQVMTLHHRRWGWEVQQDRRSKAIWKRNIF